MSNSNNGGEVKTTSSVVKESTKALDWLDGHPILVIGGALVAWSLFIVLYVNKWTTAIVTIAISTVFLAVVLKLIGEEDVPKTCKGFAKGCYSLMKKATTFFYEMAKDLTPKKEKVEEAAKKGAAIIILIGSLSFVADGCKWSRTVESKDSSYVIIEGSTVMVSRDGNLQLAYDHWYSLVGDKNVSSKGSEKMVVVKKNFTCWDYNADPIVVRSVLNLK